MSFYTVRRIWDRELTFEEIQKYKTCAVTGDEVGLVACWTFEENTGQRVLDITGNRNDACLGTTYRSEDSDPTWIRLDETAGLDIALRPGGETEGEVETD